MTNDITASGAVSANCAPDTYRDILAHTGVVLSYTRGVSMEPLIRQGRNYVAIVPVDEPSINDILLFEQKRKDGVKTILHRLIEVVEKNGQKVYVTRGDNCLYCERMLRDAIIGRVESIFTVGQDEVLSMQDPAYLAYVRHLEESWPRRRRWYRIRQSLPGRAINLLLHPSRIIPAIRRRIHK